MNDKIDMKPIILPPFKRFCMTIGTLPTSYIESMSYYETLLWLCKYLSEKVIPAIDNNAEALKEVQSLFTELQDYVNTYFDNLDVQEEINNKLDEMFEDGDLAELIKNMQLDVNGVLTLSMDYRDCTERVNGVYNDSIPIAGNLQGMTTTPTSYIITQLAGGVDTNNNMVYLKEINKETKLVTKEAYLELFHANSIAYNEEAGEVYVSATSMYDENDDYQINNDIIVVNYGDFTIKEVITPPTSITDTNRVRSVSYDNKNKVLALADISDVFIMENWNTVGQHIELDDSLTQAWGGLSGSSTTNQNTVVFDNKIYSVRLNENGINIFDMSGNLLKNHYSFDYDLPFEMGELEAISVEDDGTIYIGSLQQTNSDSTTDGFPNYKIYDTTIFKSNLKHNGYKNFVYGGNTLNRLNVYVDCETTNHYQIGTSAFPFKSIQQAIMSANFVKRDVQYRINLVGSNKQYSCIIAKNNINLDIIGNGNKVYGIQLDDQQIHIQNVIVDETAQVIMDASHNSCVRILTQSNVLFDNVTFTNSGTTYGSSVYSSNSNISFTSCTFENFTNAIYSGGNCTINEISPTYTDCTYRWLITGDGVVINSVVTSILQTLNPASTKVPITQVIQNIPMEFTQLTHTVTFASVIDTGAYPASELLFTFTLSPEGGTAVYGILRQVHNERNTWSFYRNSVQYNLYVTVAHTNGTGVYAFTPTITKTASDGTITDITSTSTFTITALRKVN